MPSWAGYLLLAWNIVVTFLWLAGKGGFILGSDEGKITKLEGEVVILRRWHHKFGDSFLDPVYEDMKEIKDRVNGLENRERERR